MISTQPALGASPLEPPNHIDTIKYSVSVHSNIYANRNHLTTPASIDIDAKIGPTNVSNWDENATVRLVSMHFELAPKMSSS